MWMTVKKIVERWPELIERPSLWPEITGVKEIREALLRGDDFPPEQFPTGVVGLEIRDLMTCYFEWLNWEGNEMAKERIPEKYVEKPYPLISLPGIKRFIPEIVRKDFIEKLIEQRRSDEIDRQIILEIFWRLEDRLAKAPV